VSITYTLPVPALPSAPSIGAAIAGDGSATISFSAPTSDGNSPITGYVATATPTDGGTPITSAATAAPFTLTGLTNRTTYTVTVAAINSVGTGPASASSNSFMPVAPMEITTPSQLPDFPINKPVSMVLNATGGTGVFSWSVLPGDSLPAGLTLGADGTIYGTPTTAVTDQVFSVRVVDGSGDAAIKAMVESIVVTRTPPAVTGTPSTASVGEGYRYAFTRTGNPLPVVAMSSGALPDGLSLSSAGVLSGTPTRAGTFTFVLSASNGVLPAASLRVSLVVRPLPTVSVADMSVTEGNSGWKAMTFTARLSRASSVPVTVFWQSSNGTATNALDFSSGSGTLTFAAGTTARTFTIWVHGDRTPEATEYFWVHLSSPSHVTLGRTWAKGTIVNDD
jgi:hypothetical protein